MNKFLMILAILLTPTLCYAEKFICFDATSKAIILKVQGDCKTIGLCLGDNNLDLQSNCILANDIEWNSTGKYKKIDLSVVGGNRVIDFTQAEKDALDAKEAQAVIDAKNIKISALDNTLAGAKLFDATMTKIDAKIDAISNLAEAKAFLKLLVRGIIKL